MYRDDKIAIMKLPRPKSKLRKKPYRLSRLIGGGSVVDSAANVVVLGVGVVKVVLVLAEASHTTKGVNNLGLVSTKYKFQTGEHVGVKDLQCG